jgi:predicted CopG family antitoxin
LTGRTALVNLLLQDVKEDIYQKLFEMKFKESFRIWIEKLRKKSYVEIKK